MISISSMTMARCSPVCKSTSVCKKFNGTQLLLPTSRLSYRPRSARVFAIKAFKETEKVQDWRVKDMVTVAHRYFIEFLDKGDETIVPEIFADDCIHTDCVWAASHPTVGIEGMKHYIHDIKAAFPDFHIDVKEIATCDTNSIWVSYEGFATGLGEYRGNKATHHTSNFSGVNIIKFNADRSKIVDVQVFRSAFAEDRQELNSEGGFRELRLKRLV